MPFPPADLPSVEETNKLTACDSSEFFFGFHTEIDHAQARKCAYLEMEGKVRSKEDIEKNFGRGYRLLALIYANGIGVKQNYSLADKFACHPEYEYTNDPNFTQADIDDIRAQVTAELQQLEAGRASGAKQPLGLCSSFHQMGKDDWCQPFEVKAERSLAIHQAMAHIEPTDRKRRSELNLLLNAEATFSKAEELEIAQDGDSPGLWEWNAARTLDLEFFGILESLFNKTLPNVGETAFIADDQRLNEAYRSVKVWGTIKKADVQSVQRAWIAYRDAWTRFVSVGFPLRAPRDVSDVLTRDRTGMLNCLGDGRPYQAFKQGRPVCGG